ncbi:MAG: ammonium transporter [Hydrogenothermaceae bacterium]|nr:ammonium transporter [Hydrogenothermaceae bacterium]
MKFDPSNTLFVLLSMILVMMMTPVGLALFYGGMTRTKNILNTIGMVFIAYVTTSLVWIFWGYSIAFGDDVVGVVGSLKNVFLMNLPSVWQTGNIPTVLFALFQMTFAAITIALIGGAVIERMKFQTWIIISILWVTFVYAPIAHWVWGGGFLAKLGVLDLAGGLAVETSSGIAGLVLAILLGNRRDYNKKAILPSSTIFTAIGAGMLWFGWFGFNAGSELAIDSVAINAVLTTNTAAAAGVISWMIAEYLKVKKFTILGASSGAVAGLVAITPAAGFVDFIGATIIGLIAGVLGFFGVFWLKKKFGYDDSLDVFGIHGLCGIWGTLATGIFANPSVNPIGKGLIYGNPKQFFIQILALIVVILFNAIATAVVYFISSFITKGARVDEDTEVRGLDETVHGERGFEFR